MPDQPSLGQGPLSRVRLDELLGRAGDSADDHGGTFEIRTGNPTGTVVDWSVPL